MSIHSATFLAALMMWDGIGIFFSSPFSIAWNMLFLGKYHLANFLPLCNTWSALVVPFSLLTHIIITKTFCLCFNDFMLVTDRQVMGVGGAVVHSRCSPGPPFIVNFYFTVTVSCRRPGSVMWVVFHSPCWSKASLSLSATCTLNTVSQSPLLPQLFLLQ